MINKKDKPLINYNKNIFFNRILKKMESTNINRWIFHCSTSNILTTKNRDGLSNNSQD